MADKQEAVIYVEAASKRELNDLKEQLRESRETAANLMLIRGTLRTQTEKALEALKAARYFMHWYREMAIEGQISVSNYALQKRPVGWGADYELMRCVDTAIERIEMGEVLPCADAPNDTIAGKGSGKEVTNET
jgi:hypothetical protein